MNPFKRGDTVIVPAGTPFVYRGGYGVTKREQTGTVNQVMQGYEHGGRKVLPVIYFMARGGYLRQVRVTPELLERNGKAEQ